MKSGLPKAVVSFALLISVAVAPASATLFDRGNGLIYDAHLDVTWLKDANLAATNQFGMTQNAGVFPPPGEIGSTGYMAWATADNWIAGMNAVNYKEINTWRLPTTAVPDPVCGSTSFGKGCTGSEMGALAQLGPLRTVDANPSPLRP